MPPTPSFTATFQGNTFDDPDTSFEAVREFAKANMFALFFRSSKTNRHVWVCSKAGRYDPRGKREGVDPSRRRQGRSKKTDCQWSVECKYIAGIGWRVYTLDPEHNHDPVDWIGALPEYRIEDLLPEDIDEILCLARSGSALKDILSFLREKNHDCLLTVKDISNLTQQGRLVELGGRRPVEWLLSVSFSLSRK
jgi:hypothetical protein